MAAMTTTPPAAPAMIPMFELEELATVLPGEWVPEVEWDPGVDVVVEPEVADPKAVSWLATTGSMLATPSGVEPTEATSSRILPEMAAPTVAFWPLPLQVATAEFGTFVIAGVDEGVTFVAPLQKSEASF
jgi:hypothetical protein